MSKMNKKVEDKLFELLQKTPLDWEFNRTVARHKPSGIELWIANAPFQDLTLYKPVETGRVSFWNRGRMRRLLEAVKTAIVANGIIESMQPTKQSDGSVPSPYFRRST